MCNKIKWVGIITAIVMVVAACKEGTIPVMITDIGGFELPLYAPGNDGSPNWGDEQYRVNHEGLSIKHSYKTSDDVIHIVLTGKIPNGIPQGLLWNQLNATGPYNISNANTFGITQTGLYASRGDYRIGVVNGYEDPGLQQDDAGTPNYVVALGSPDFSAEWVMAAPYSAVVISGLVDAGATNVTITETNDSLHLFSRNYRLARSGMFRYNNNGILQYVNAYPYDPNLFSPGTHGRGGYGFLISKKANPQMAFFEIEYRGGKKTLIEVDYSEVTLRKEVDLALVRLNPTTYPVKFQANTPKRTLPPAAGYILDTPSRSGDTLYQQIPPLPLNNPVPINLIDITVEDLLEQPPNPLYLRPFYDTANIDPSLAPTNMIKEIYLTNTLTRERIEPKDLFLGWDDEVQAITLKFKKDGIRPTSNITINAELHNQFPDPTGGIVKRLSCRVTLQ